MSCFHVSLPLYRLYQGNILKRMCTDLIPWTRLNCSNLWRFAASKNVIKVHRSGLQKTKDVKTGSFNKIINGFTSVVTTRRVYYCQPPVIANNAIQSNCESLSVMQRDMKVVVIIVIAYFFVYVHKLNYPHMSNLIHFTTILWYWNMTFCPSYITI